MVQRRTLHHVGQLVKVSARAMVVSPWQHFFSRFVRVSKQAVVPQKKVSSKKKANLSSTLLIAQSQGVIDIKKLPFYQKPSFRQSELLVREETKEQSKDRKNTRENKQKAQASFMRVDLLAGAAGVALMEGKDQTEDEKKTIVIINKLKIAHEKDDYEEQVVGFIVLGDHFCQKGGFINATAIYHFALAICSNTAKNKKFKTKVESYQAILKKSLAYAERQFLVSLGKETKLSSDAELFQKHQDHKKVLTNIREWARDQLKLVTKPDTVVLVEHQGIVERETLKANAMQEIYRGVSERLRGFVKDLIVECKTTLGDPPDQLCSYAVICFGSLARDEATPYSDLEFGILLEEKADTERNKEYFRNLTRFLQLKVINLGETTPRMQDIRVLGSLQLLDRYSEGPIKHGFCFDGQGKNGCVTPLGNRVCSEVAKEEQYELILTPTQMAQFQSKEFYRKNSHLTTALSIAEFIEGNDRSLLNAYQTNMAHILKEEAIPRTSTANKPKITLEQDRALVLLAESLDKFNPTIGLHEKKGHFFNVKYDFYRLPHMLISHLATFYGIKLNGSWQQLQELHARGIFSDEAYTHLIRAFSKIAEIRLNTYLSYDGYDNRVVAKDRQDPERSKELLTQLFNMDWNEIEEIYYTLIPLANSLKKFSLNLNFREGLCCYDNGLATKAEIRFLLFDYEESNKLYKEELASCSTDPSKRLHVAAILNNMAENYLHLSEYQQSIMQLTQALSIREDQLGSIHPDILQALINLSVVLIETNDYAKATDYIDRAISGFQQQGIYNPELAKALFTKGRLLTQRGYFDGAIDCYKKAEYIMRENYGDNNFSVGVVLAEMGAAYISNGRIDEGMYSFKKALVILQEKYGSRHPQVASVLTNIGCAYTDLRKFDEAIRYHEEAFSIYKTVLRGVHNSDSIAVLNNLANAYKEKGDIDRAIKEQEFILKENKRIYGEIHLYVGESCRALGDLYKYKIPRGGLKDCTSEHNPELLLNQALSIFRAIDAESPQVGLTLNDLGSLFRTLGQSDRAIDHFQRAISIYEKRPSKNTRNMTTSLNNLACAYADVEDYLNAIRTFRKIHDAHNYVAEMNHCMRRFIPQYVKLTHISSGSHLCSIEKEISEVLIIAKEIFGEQQALSKKLNQLVSDCRKKMGPAIYSKCVTDLLNKGQQDDPGRSCRSRL